MLLLVCFDYNLISHRDKCTIEGVAISSNFNCTFLVELSDTRNEVEAHLGSEGEIEQYLKEAINAFAVRHRVERVIQCCIKAGETEE